MKNGRIPARQAAPGRYVRPSLTLIPALTPFAPVLRGSQRLRSGRAFRHFAFASAAHSLAYARSACGRLRRGYNPLRISSVTHWLSFIRLAVVRGVVTTPSCLIVQCFFLVPDYLERNVKFSRSFFVFAEKVFLAFKSRENLPERHFVAFFCSQEPF